MANVNLDFNPDEIVNYKLAGYRIQAMSDPNVDALLIAGAKTELLGKQMSAVSDQMKLAMQVRLHADFISDPDKKKLAISKCDTALEKAITLLSETL